MNPRRMMSVGLIMVLAAIGIFVFGFFMVGEEEDSMKKAVRFEGAAAGAEGKGGLVIVEGKVSVKNRILIRDFVDAAKEHQVKGGSWSILEAYRQPIIADLARGEIILTSENLCTEAKGNIVHETDEKSDWNKKVRYIGLKRGDPITAIGTLTSPAPAALTVKYWYSGSFADYKEYLASSRNGLYIFCVLIALAGTGLLFRGLKRS